MPAKPKEHDGEVTWKGARRCMAHNRQGERCKKPATDGFNVCFLHGAGKKKGPPTGAPITHGASSLRLRRIRDAEQQARLDELLKDPEFLDLARSIGLAQLLLEETMLPDLSSNTLAQMLRKKHPELYTTIDPSDGEIEALRAHLLDKHMGVVTKYGRLQVQARRALGQEQLLAQLVLPVLGRLGREFMAIVERHVTPEQMAAIREEMEASKARAVLDVQAKLETEG